MHRLDTNSFGTNVTLENRSKIFGRIIVQKEKIKHTSYSKTNALLPWARIQNTYSGPYGNRPTGKCPGVPPRRSGPDTSPGFRKIRVGCLFAAKSEMPTVHAFHSYRDIAVDDASSDWVGSATTRQYSNSTRGPFRPNNVRPLPVTLNGIVGVCRRRVPPNGDSDQRTFGFTTGIAVGKSRRPRTTPDGVRSGEFQWADGGVCRWFSTDIGSVTRLE